MARFILLLEAAWSSRLARIRLSSRSSRSSSVMDLVPQKRGRQFLCSRSV
jgi:hypothetical protein